MAEYFAGNSLLPRLEKKVAKKLVVMGRVKKSRVRVLKSRARSSPSLDSSSKIEYESAKKCRVRVEAES